MEVGAVKQAFNNEIILLKKNLNQAKTQTIHKLTRKAKQLAEKKAPDEIKEKFTRKAEAAVKEVLILKKIKPRDIAQFIVTHKGQLNDFLNKLDKDKACARLLLHKAMQQKYKHIREKFHNVSIKDLFMSRQERLKLKKEARENQNNKNNAKAKNKDKAVNVEGEWDVEITDTKVNNMEQSNDNDLTEAENMSNGSVSDSHLVDEKGSDGDISEDDIDDGSNNENSDIPDDNDDSSKEEFLPDIKSPNLVKSGTIHQKTIVKKLPQKIKKPKENKNKNLNEKLQGRKFNKDSDDNPLEATKVVDPFFITSSGENYMSLVEPRQPDEVKEVHKQGNRKYRRAVLFGHEPKPKIRKKFDESKNNFVDQKSNYNSQNGDRFGRNDKFERNKYDKNNYDRNNKQVVNEIPEKLHPSWEAKKKQSSILPFQGKKIVFDES